MTTGRMTETSLCLRAALTLRAKGYEVYPEIEGIDLLCRQPATATTPDLLIAVEAKLAPSLTLLRQALERRDGDIGGVDGAVCLLPGRTGAHDPQLEHLCRGVGLGLWLITGTDLHTVCDPQITPRRSSAIADLLCPEAMAFAVPGAPAPRRWNRWSLLESRLAAWIIEHGTNGKADIGHALATIEPAALTRKGRPLRRWYQLIDSLISSRRWRRVQRRGEMLVVGSDRSDAQHILGLDHKPGAHL